jgi:hypothetical protein
MHVTRPAFGISDLNGILTQMIVRCQESFTTCFRLSKTAWLSHVCQSKVAGNSRGPTGCDRSREAYSVSTVAPGSALCEGWPAAGR